MNCSFKRVFCSVIKSVCSVDDSPPVDVYGLEAVCGNHRMRIENISDDPDNVRRLSDMINENDVDMVHLRDIVDDWLT